MLIIIMSILSVIFTRAPGMTFAFVIIAVAIIASVVALVYYAIRFALSGVICILESLKPVASLRTSYALIKKHVTPVIGVYALIIIFISLCFIPVFIFGPMIASKGMAVILLASYQALVGAILVPVVIWITVILYKKLKEAVN